MDQKKLTAVIQQPVESIIGSLGWGRRVTPDDLSQMAQEAAQAIGKHRENLDLKGLQRLLQAEFQRVHTHARADIASASANRETSLVTQKVLEFFAKEVNAGQTTKDGSAVVADRSGPNPAATHLVVGNQTFVASATARGVPPIKQIVASGGESATGIVAGMNANAADPGDNNKEPPKGRAP